MLLNKQRKRSLKATLVPRPAHWSRAAPSRPPAASPPPAATPEAPPANTPGGRPQLTVEAAPRVREQPVGVRGRRGERRSEMTAQERALVAQAFRARYALSERQVLIHLRLRHRVQLLDELARLAGVARDLEAQIDAAAQRVQTVERVAMHLERIGALLQDDSAAEPVRPPAAAESASDAAVTAAPAADAE